MFLSRYTVAESIDLDIGISLWRHQTNPFSALLTFSWWIPPVIPLTKASDAELWWFFFIGPWRYGWANNRDVGDLRRHCVHYDFIVMWRTGTSISSRCQFSLLIHTHTYIYIYVIWFPIKLNHWLWVAVAHLPVFAEAHLCAYWKLKTDDLALLVLRPRCFMRNKLITVMPQ